MGIDAKQFRQLIIMPTLEKMARVIHPLMYTIHSVNLLLETACAESHLTYLKQLNGHALGFYQMEETTYEWLINYAVESAIAPKLRWVIYDTTQQDFPDFDDIVFDLKLQTAFARLKYWSIEEPIPEAPQARAAYWKKYYNSPLGKGTVAHYLNSIPELN